MFSKKSLILSLLMNFLLLNINIESKSLVEKLKNFKTKNKSKITELFDNFHTVQKNKIYRSKQLTPKKLNFYIKKYDIKNVINLRGENPGKKWWEQEKEITQKNNTNFYNISLSAARLPNKENIIYLLKLYDKLNEPILIHCRGGADRTGMACALWRLYKEKTNKKIAKKQLSLRFRHSKNKNPAMKFFITIWEGKEWLEKSYEHTNYPKYNQET